MVRATPTIENKKRNLQKNLWGEAPARFELAISCLLDRRFNQLSHGAAAEVWLLKTG